MSKLAGVCIAGRNYADSTYKDFGLPVPLISGAPQLLVQEHVYSPDSGLTRFRQARGRNREFDVDRRYRAQV